MISCGWAVVPVDRAVAVDLDRELGGESSLLHLSSIGGG